MILRIDTTERNQIIIGLGETTHLLVGADKRMVGRSENILQVIDALLKRRKIGLKNLKAILANCGPGSFTSVRVGVTVANTIGWVLNIPVYGYKEGKQEKVLADILKKPQTQFSKIALPYYF